MGCGGGGDGSEGEKVRGPGSTVRGVACNGVDDGGNNGIEGESEAEDALEAGCEWFAVNDGCRSCKGMNKTMGKN